MKAVRAALGAALAVIVAAAAPGRIHAQQGDTLVLSLDRALEIARRSNPAYSRAVNDLGLNAPDRQAAWATQILPKLELNLGTSYSGNLQRRATDPFGNPVENPDASYSYFSNTQQGLGLSWQLQGLSPLTRKQGVDARVEQRRVAEDVAGETLRLGLRRRFFDALEQDELLGAERAVADATRSDREVAERLFELAMKTRVDVLQAELSIQQQELVVRQQLGRRDQARLALRAVLGEQDLPPVRPQVTEPPIFDPSTLDAETLVRKAVDQSASVRQGEAELRQADVQVSAMHGTYWPTLVASWRIGRLAQGQQSESLFSFGGFGNTLYSAFNVQMSVPFLNDVTGSRLRVSQAEIQRENQRDDLRQARLEAEQNARVALVTLRNSWESLTIADRALSIAGEALELAREEYRLGGRSFEQLQLSVRSEADARRQQIQARYGFVDALLDLEGAVGGPVR